MNTPRRLEGDSDDSAAIGVRQHILVIEDNPITLKMVRVALGVEGYEVIGVGDGRSALDAITARRPDLILMDLILPDVNGESLLKQVRELDNGREVPVLAFTGFVSRAEEMRYSGSDFAGFLIKPVEIAQLLQTVRRHLQFPGGNHGTAERPRRIILVDDDPLQLKALALLLTRAGHQVLTANSAATALELARREHPDMVLADILMPGTDGFTLCRQIRTDPVLGDIPVILITANYVTEEDEQFARHSGANAFLTRNVTTDELVAAIDEAAKRTPPPVTRADEDLQREHVARMVHQLERQVLLHREAVQRSAVQGALLHQVSAIADTLSQHRDPSLNIADILTPCLDSAGLSRGLLYTLDADGSLKLEAQVGCDACVESAQALFGVSELFTRLAAGQTPMALTAATARGDENRLLREAQAEAALLFPIIVQDLPAGAFVLLSSSRDISRDDWLAFGRALASQVGVTLTLSRTIAALAESERRFRMIYERAHDAICIFDDELDIVELNPAGYALSGYTSELPPRMSVKDLTPEYFKPKLQLLMHRLKQEGRIGSEEFALLRADGDERTLRLNATRIAPNLYVAICQDITPQKRHQEAIQRIAYTDLLTDLPNRTALKQRVDELVRKIRGSNRQFAIAVIDLSNFRQINGTLGHGNGDLVLTLVAGRLRTAAAGAMVARVGSDEFLILIEDANSIEAVEAFIDRLLASLEADFVIDDIPVAVDAFAGYALGSAESGDAHELIKKAHLAVAVAQKTHRPCVRYAESIDEFRPENLAVLAEIRQALARDELVLHYQPQLQLSTRQVRCVEALVRWRHPTRGLLMPIAFLPIIEHTRFIDALTQWVLRNALRQLQQWERQGLVLDVAVNITAHELDAHFPDRIRSILDQAGVPPSRLVLELNEGTLFETVGTTFDTLQALRDMGIRLALDDFGAGYSALSYFGRLPISIVKLDKSFAIRFRDRWSQAVIRAAITLAKQLGLAVTAEGIEDGDTLERLAAWDCDEGQGFHLAKGLPPEDLVQWLATTPHIRRG